MEFIEVVVFSVVDIAVFAGTVAVDGVGLAAYMVYMLVERRVRCANGSRLL
jgi:hypothetical protein